jgi:hypothetical protein
MKDLERALSEIHSIRHQVARGTQFRAYGPASIAFSGILALAVAWGQVEWGGRAKNDFMANLIIWISVAAISVAVSGIETFARAQRVHFGVAQEMLHSAVEQFLPALVMGVLLTAVLIRFAPGDCWLLPGIWELIFSLGIFASCRFLPRQMFAVGVWYLAAGLGSIIVASSPRAFLPWTMGIPFGVGQLSVAAVLRLYSEDNFEET